LIESDLVEIGRSEGHLRLGEDPYLAPRHARIERRDASFWLKPIDTLNGVFVRLGEPVTLEDGDRFLIGRQLLRFERLLEAEREPQELWEHGVLLLGSPAAPLWGRLRHLGPTGVARAVHGLWQRVVALGSSDADLRFPDDDQVSPRHALLEENQGSVRLADAGSERGTFLRLHKPRELHAGDWIRLGQQLLRFDL
jgi:pSer/pThr/pTyr-binding forkhead associated (FHA) protein